MACITELKKTALYNLEYWKESMINKNKYLFSNLTMREAWNCNTIFYQVNVTEEKFFKMIESITSKDVMAVSRELFDFSKMGIATVGNYTKTDEMIKELEDLRDTYQKISLY
jgi:hypothetical protein